MGKIGIDITKLTEEDRNQKVVYHPDFGKSEEGIITSWNSRFVFVDYSNCGRGTATPPNRLEFLSR